MCCEGQIYTGYVPICRCAVPMAMVWLEMKGCVGRGRCVLGMGMFPSAGVLRLTQLPEAKMTVTALLTGEHT